MLTLAPHFRVYDALLSTYGCNHTEAIVYSRLHARYTPGVQIRVVREREAYANNITRHTFERTIIRLADYGLITYTEVKRDSRQYDYLVSFVPAAMECFGRFTPVFYEATATYGLSPIEAYAFGMLATASKGTIVRQSVSGIKMRLGISYKTDFVKTLRKFREAGIINCKWVDADKHNLFDVITLPAYCCNSKKQAAADMAEIRTEYGREMDGIRTEHGQKFLPQTPYNENIEKENKEKENLKEKAVIAPEANAAEVSQGEQNNTPLNPPTPQAPLAPEEDVTIARDRALASIERLMQQTKDPTGQKQRARAIREEIRHAPVVANASATNGAPTATGNPEADKILAQAYRYGQKAKEEMLSIKKAIQRFESVRIFQEYGLDVLRVEFLRGYRNS